MFNKKYGINSVNIPDQKGNYRETLRVNDDLINLLNWQPKDRLKEYIETYKLQNEKYFDNRRGRIYFSSFNLLFN
jgi:hypothetical protein